MIKIVDIYLIYELDIFSLREHNNNNKDGLFEIHYIKDNQLFKFYTFIFFFIIDKYYVVQHNDYSHNINESTKYLIEYETKDFARFFKVFEKQKINIFSKENIKDLYLLIDIDSKKK